jgi:hypothetical protein
MQVRERNKTGKGGGILIAGKKKGRSGPARF